MKKDYYRIQFRGVELDVKGVYYPYEKGYMYDNNLDGLPGSASDFEIDKITIIDSSVDVYDLFSTADLDIIKDRVIDLIEK